MAIRNANSLETILTIDNRDNDSVFSVVWSTTHVPGMDMGTGGRPVRRAAGRRRLRVGALALGCMLTMHCRVAASALTGGLFVFILLLVPSVALLANPLRHFEVYLGQWSISGPGRAFRIVPAFDGIGLAMCVSAIVRAVCCGAMAAVAGLYVVNGLADRRLPSRHCRTFDFIPYEPGPVNVATLRNFEDLQPEEFPETEVYLDTGVDVIDSVVVGPVGTSLDSRNTTRHTFTSDSIPSSSLRSINYPGENDRENEISIRRVAIRFNVCRETFTEEYPQIYRTPPYNFFYVELVKLQPDYNFAIFNLNLVWSLVAVWGIIWIVMISEKLSHGRLIWNNMYTWFIVIPWLWSAILMTVSVLAYISKNKSIKKIFKFSSKEVVAGISDALEVAIYIHVAGIGTEIVHGKGLNYYASGHIDPSLNNENVWHSSMLVLLTILNSGGAAVCALVDVKHPSLQAFDHIIESTMWVMPLYSKCTSVGEFSHLQTILIFSGLMFSYITTAFVFLKTALHIIFEYKVKLVFYEQLLVAALIITCLLFSMIFATSGGLPLLESMESLMVGLAMPLVCLLELAALLHAYRGRDFVSDMHVANEDTTCSTRLGTQWHIVPIITATMVIMKIVVLTKAEFPSPYLCYAAVPLLAALLAAPARAAANAYRFLRSRRR